MGRRAVLAVFVILLGSATARAELVVRTEGELIEVTARAVPLDEVLRSFAAETGATVSFEGPAPRQPVTVDLKGLTPARAVVEILEGLGISYVLRSDPSGTRVEAIHVIDGATGRELARPANRSRPPEADPWPDPDLGDPDPGLEDSVDEEDEEPRALRQPGVRIPRPAGPGSSGVLEPWEDAPAPPGGVEPPDLDSAPVTESKQPPGPPMPATPSTMPPGMSPSRPEDGAAGIEGPMPAPPGSGVGTGEPRVTPPGMRLEGGTPPVPPPG